MELKRPRRFSKRYFVEKGRKGGQNRAKNKGYYRSAAHKRQDKGLMNWPEPW